MLERYRFPGRRLIDALVDLPFALPDRGRRHRPHRGSTPTRLDRRPLAPLGIKVAYTPLGVAVALTFIGLPFVVRTVQPVLRDLDPAIEEAAAILGASRLQTLLPRRPARARAGRGSPASSSPWRAGSASTAR